jgi:hypothetical protein
LTPANAVSSCGRCYVWDVIAGDALVNVKLEIGTVVQF